jgi:hypothetical protein
MEQETPAENRLASKTQRSAFPTFTQLRRLFSVMKFNQLVVLSRERFLGADQKVS